MTNVLICYYSAAGSSKYQDLANSLCEEGNRVLQWNVKDWGNVKDSALDKQNILEQVSLFKADLIFSYNNCLPEELFYNVECPILIVDADNPEMFFNKELLKKNFNKDNLYYLFYQSNSRLLYKKIFDFDVDDKKSLFFPPASNFKNRPTSDPKINISFIGSNFFHNYINYYQESELKDFFSIFDSVRSDYFYKNNSTKIDESVIERVKYVIAGQERISYLECVSDLGLEIYSNSDWKIGLINVNAKVASCYKDKPITTNVENENLYNSSKISINLSHPQAINSFSWRVPDIMASNSCLVMEDKPDWHEVFGKYISTEVKEAIIYQDQYDMRQKCIKLLNDEELRLQCVKECQNAIEKNGRWRHRLIEISNLLEINLINNKNIIEDEHNQRNNILVLSTGVVIKKNNGIIEDEHNQRNNILVLSTGGVIKKNNGSIKLFYYSFLIFIYFVPFCGKIIIKKKKIIKIINKIMMKITTIR